MARALGPRLPSQQLCCGRWLPAAPCQLRSPGCRSPFLWLPGTSTVTAVPRALSGTPDQGQPEALWVALVSSANSTTWPNPVSLFSSANFRPLANGPEGSAPSSAARRARHTPRPAEPAFGAAGPAGEDVHVTLSREQDSSLSPPVVHTASALFRDEAWSFRGGVCSQSRSWSRGQGHVASGRRAGSWLQRSAMTTQTPWDVHCRPFSGPAQMTDTRPALGTLAEPGTPGL